MEGQKIDLFDIAQVKVEFIPILKIYAIPILEDLSEVQMCFVYKINSFFCSIIVNALVHKK